MNRKLQFLSSDTACADYLDLICDDENYDDFASDVAGWLVENIDRKGEWSGFDSFELKGIAANGRANQRLVPVLVEHGFQRFETDLENCWAVELPSTWEELNSRFSKKHRRKTKKAIKHLADPQTTIHSTDTQDFDSLWESFVNLHQKRRVSIGQAGCFASSGFHKFLKSTAAAMVASGSAQMVEIRTGGVAFASMLLLKNDKQSFMYQTGMDPQYSKLEPGYQLITYALQSAILDQHDTFDFLRGDEPYKARWNTEAIPLVRSRLIPPKFSASLRHQIWLSSRAIKQYATNIGLLR